MSGNEENILGRIEGWFRKKRENPEKATETITMEAMNVGENEKNTKEEEEMTIERKMNDMVNGLEVNGLEMKLVNPVEEQNRFAEQNKCECGCECECEKSEPKLTPQREKYYISIRTGSLRTREEFEELVEKDCPAEQGETDNERTLGLMELTEVRFELRTLKSDGKPMVFAANLREDEQFEGLLNYIEGGMTTALYINPDNGNMVTQAGIEALKSLFMQSTHADADSAPVNELTALFNRSVVKIDKIIAVAVTSLLGEREIPVKNDRFMADLLKFQKSLVDPMYFERKLVVVDTEEEQKVESEEEVE